MSLLRRVKTTIYASRSGVDTTNADNNQTHDNSATKARRRTNQPDISSQAVASPHSVHPRQPFINHQDPLYNPITAFRKRLARKASAFSFGSKTKSTQSPETIRRKTNNRAGTYIEKDLPEPPTLSVCSSPIVQDKGRSQWDINSSRSTIILSGDRSTDHSTDLNAFPSPPKSKQGVDLRPVKAPANSPSSNFTLRSLQETIHLKQRLLKQEGYVQQFHSDQHTSVRMAAENAAPPVPYSRLQELTISACDKALSSVSTYNHAATEDWNTTIINTILGTLVSETTPTSSDKSAQPQFKYVVNSTIIQHAPTSTGGTADPAVTGRRGMHAASGAYWNNEKDGMWSYKYSAAEMKGLDVVVGVIWIWVG